MSKHPAHPSQNRLLQQSWVYLLCNIPFIFMCKWGISDKPKTRVSQVDKSTIGDVKMVHSAGIPFAWQAEGLVRIMYCWSNVGNIAPFLLRGASGRTEWHLNINLIVGGAVWWFGSHMGMVAHCFGSDLNWRWYALVIFFPVVWLDGLLWILIFRALGWFAAAVLLYGAWWFIQNA